jgi:hypothetical protein
MSPSAWHWVSLLGIGASLLLGIGVMSLVLYSNHENLNGPDRE